MADNSFRLKECYIVLAAGVSAVLFSQQSGEIIIGIFLAVMTGIFYY